MNKIKLSESLQLSRIIHGHWRLSDWGKNPQEVLRLTEQAIELGITSFDNADIYGNHECEGLFGSALNLRKELRNDIQIVTKLGIKLNTDKFPHRKIKIYDYSFDYILNSVEISLGKLNTDYIDLLLIHRPSPFFNPEEVAAAFSKLKKDGKVLNFGVSNFYPQQWDMLSSYVDEKLVTNQVEISPSCLEHFDNGNIDKFLQERIKPMAWSPLAEGKIFVPTSEKEIRINKVMSEIADELHINSLDKVAYRWLLMHPSTILPVVGTSKIERLKNAVESLNIEMSLEQWFRIYTASTGTDLP